MTPHSMHTTVFDIDKLYGKSTISKATPYTSIEGI